jgi:hypothetical protein
LNELPEEVKALISAHEKQSAEVLDAIGVSITRRKDEAKAARRHSGIEDTWIDAEEAYLGIDDANRAEFSAARWMKPSSMDGPITTGRRTTGEEVKSNAFVRLTSRYVDAGAAKLGEILLPIDDKAFSFGPTHIPELFK